MCALLHSRIANMEPQYSCKNEPLQGSFERELEKIFVAFRGADKTGLGYNYRLGVLLLLSTLCFNTYGDDNDTWPSVEGRARFYQDDQGDQGEDFTIHMGHFSRNTAGRDFTTTPILLITCMDNDLGEKDDDKSYIYERLRSQVRITFEEMQGQPPLLRGRPNDLSTLCFLGGKWRWDDWSYEHTSFPVRMERGRGESVIRAKATFSSGIEAYKAWEVPTPVGLDIDPNFLELWAELLEEYGLEHRIFTREGPPAHRSETM